jgi:hypothetical protein
MFSPRNVNFNAFTYHIWTIKISAMAFLDDLALFQCSGLPVRRFSSNQKYFFINTNSVEGFLLQQRQSNGCLKLPRELLQKNSVFWLKMAIFKASAAGSNVVQMS